LIWSQNPLLTAEEVKQRLLESVDDLDFGDCDSDFSGQLGAGRVNAYNAVAACEDDLTGDGDVDGRDLADFIARAAAGSTNDGDFLTLALDFGRSGCPF
jgi:hypothetical protein